VTFGFPNSKKNSFRGNYMRKYGRCFIFSDYEIDQFRKPDTGPGSIPHTKEEAKKSGMNENEWRNEGQTQASDDKPPWAKAEDTPIEESQSQKHCAWETTSDGNYLQGESLNV
jgi:hypothetical protein